MTRSKLVTGLAADNPHLKIADIRRMVDTVFIEMTGALARGERVELCGFGVFTAKRHNARATRNPRTGESLEVAQKFEPFSTAGKELRERVNETMPAMVQIPLSWIFKTGNTVDFLRLFRFRLRTKTNFAPEPLPAPSSPCWPADWRGPAATGPFRPARSQSPFHPTIARLRWPASRPP
jgi:integration host factor subunit beta